MLKTGNSTQNSNKNREIKWDNKKKIKIKIDGEKKNLNLKQFIILSV